MQSPAPPSCTSSSESALSAARVADASRLYGEHCKPRLQSLMSLFALDVTYVRAAGELLFRADKNGSETAVYDFLGGYGCTILGHNPPALVQCMQRALTDQIAIQAQLSTRSDTAFLAQRLSAMLEERLKSPYIVTLVNTGAEAIELALKHALMQWRDRQSDLLLLGKRTVARSPELQAEIVPLQSRVMESVPVLIAVEGSFHGNTAGALSGTFETVYRSMYTQLPLHTVFLPRTASPADVARLFDEQQIPLFGGVSFCRVAAAALELVQGEGGGHVLSPELVSSIAGECRRRGVPLLVDEIQTGCFRTGRLLCCEHLQQLQPDYLALGKALGGGMVKIAALLVRKQVYQQQLSLVHTSTFAEDDLASRVALRTLELLEADSALLQQRAERFESHLRERVQALQRRYPNTLRDVRGRGLLLGLELDPAALTRDGGSVVFLAFFRTGLFAYLVSSFLLHRYNVRVAPTLGHRSTLRLEPPAVVSDAAVDRLLQGLEHVCAVLHDPDRLPELTQHLFRADQRLVAKLQRRMQRYQRRLQAAVPPLPPLPPASTLRSGSPRTVSFITHFIDAQNAAALDPFLGALQLADRERLLSTLWPLTQSGIFHEQTVHGAGAVPPVHFCLRGLFAVSSSFEACLRNADSTATYKVRDAVLAAIADGSSHIGLGQFTSVVTDSGNLLIDLVAGDSGVYITTGNALTIGLAYRGLRRIVEQQRGWRWPVLHVGVVGVAGNICGTLAQLLADDVRELTAVHREPFATSERFQKAVAGLVEHSRLPRERIHPTCELSALIDCDVVVIGTNSTGKLVLPQHLKQNAVVLDISVPSNVSPAVFAERPDVACFAGGLAKLPLGQKLSSPEGLLPVPDGQVFACMAETITLGLLNYPGCFSFGPLTKAKVLQILDMANRVGIELGDSLTLSVLQQPGSRQVAIQQQKAPEQKQHHQHQRHRKHHRTQKHQHLDTPTAETPTLKAVTANAAPAAAADQTVAGSIAALG